MDLPLKQHLSEETPLAPSGRPSAGGTFDSSPHHDSSHHVLDELPFGLTDEEAQRRLREDGHNVLDTGAKESFFGILLTQMKNMIFLLSLCAGTLSWLIGDRVKAYVILGIVLAVLLANTVGEYSAQDAGEALAQMTSPDALVVRDGVDTMVPSKDLVVGDLVKVKIGDIVPADMILVKCTDLQMMESALTGESHEMPKTVEHRVDSKANFPTNMLYAATSVVTGKGMGEVVATGMRTQMGIIAQRLKHQDETLQLNPLQRSINLLGLLIGGACMLVVVIATLTAYLSKYQNPMDPCADDDDTCLLVTSLVRGLILAVALIPHGLPLIVMVMLRVGSFQMAQRNAVVTRQSTVDYLGATTVICTDKTGTLTEGKMTAELVVGMSRKSAEGGSCLSDLAFYPLRGNCPNGGLFKAPLLSKERKEQMDSKFQLREKRQNFSSPGLRDLALLDQAASEASQDALLARAHLACAFLSCYETHLECDSATGLWNTLGNMTEGALKVAAAKGGYWETEGIGPELSQVRYPRESELEVPFSSKRKMAATTHELPSNRRLESLQFQESVTHVAIVKGAPDLLLPKVSSLPSVAEVDGSKVLNVPGERLLDEDRAELFNKNDTLSQKALRSLVVAVRPLTEREVEEMKAGTAKERLSTLVDTPGLCFLSLWGISDPPRVMVPPSVDECHRAGIRVVMITGDQRPTAVAVGRQVHILDQDDSEEPAQAKDCAELYEVEHIKPWERATNRLSKIAHQALRKLGETQQDSPRMKLRKSMRQALSPRPVRPAMTQKNEAEPEHERKYLSPEEINEMTSHVNVWARAHPADKVAIVSSLTQQGNITAMTGDGVNDAPALKHAMVGVSMGVAGTEVAKSASELILMDDDFSTIVAAIREGRKIYANVQKYVVFNLSIKSGECVCLLSSIAAGVPMPIRGLQLLFNLLCTHIIPTMALAIEEAEPYLMKVPPRHTHRDLVVPAVMWLFRWLPFVACMPTVVLSCLVLGVWMHTGFVNGNSIIGSSRVVGLDAGLYACEYAGELSMEGRFLDDHMPFHCRCHTHDYGLLWSSVSTVDQWGRSSPAPGEFEAVFDPWTGSTGNLYSVDQTPWKHGREDLLEPCTDRRGVKRWCWKEKGLHEERPLLPPSQHCAAYGARLGQSMAYVTIHLGEILSLMTFRMDGWFAKKAFSNPSFNGLLVFNLSALIIFLYVPPVASILELAPLTASRFGLAACFAVSLMLLNEVVKVLYRQQLAKRIAVLEAESLRSSHNPKGPGPRPNKRPQKRRQTVW